jgi:hypothetical protein
MQFQETLCIINKMCDVKYINILSKIQDQTTFSNILLDKNIMLHHVISTNFAIINFEASLPA